MSHLWHNHHKRVSNFTIYFFSSGTNHFQHRRSVSHIRVSSLFSGWRNINTQALLWLSVLSLPASKSANGTGTNCNFIIVSINSVKQRRKKNCCSWINAVWVLLLPVRKVWASELEPKIIFVDLFFAHKKVPV